MLDKAINKIKAEIDGNKNNPYIKVVGEFILQHLQGNPSDAEKIIQDGKTIKGSIDEMKKVAKTKAVDGCGMLTDQEGFEIVLKYFGIKVTPITVTSSPAEDVQVKAPTAQNKKPSVEFNVELDF